MFRSAALPWVVATLLVTHGLAFSLGIVAERRAEQGRRVDALARSAEKAGGASANIAKTGERLAGALERSKAEEREGVKTVTESLNDHKDFADLRRPDDLQRVRDEELLRIRSAE